jgi:hypothetical protein
VNSDWHAGHRLPHGASLEQRVDWHIEHAQACGCRPIPPDIVKAIEQGRTPKPD